MAPGQQYGQQHEARNRGGLNGSAAQDGRQAAAMMHPDARQAAPAAVAPKIPPIPPERSRSKGRVGMYVALLAAAGLVLSFALL